MTKKNKLDIDLEKFKNKIEKIPVTKINELDIILFDIENHIYDAYELVCQLSLNNRL